MAAGLWLCKEGGVVGVAGLPAESRHSQVQSQSRDLAPRMGFLLR